MTLFRFARDRCIPLFTGLNDADGIKARWSTTDNNRRAKYYELTRSGRQKLEAQTDLWRRLTAAVGQILDTA